MAKGFTVKAKNPISKKEPDWDIDAIKARWKGKTVVFCLPGRQNTTVLPFHLSLIAGISHLGASLVGALALTVNPFAITCNYFISIIE